MNYIFGNYVNFLFALRALHLSKPVRLLMFTLCYSCAILSYQLRLCEQPLSGTKGLGSYINACWTTIVTMTTVGYGDISPVTPLGKLTSYGTALWGAAYSALAVVTMERVTRQNKREK